jgi:2,3-diaminopropionate biosynthesis protein SbnB
MTDVPEFVVVTAPEIRRCIDGARAECVEIVRRAYLAHHEGLSVLPHSSFLRLPQRPRDRIIGLPGYLGGETEVAGIKWISSWPGNPAHGRPRASAVLVLNDTETGFAFACLESSLISATRTAASAVLATEALAGGRVAARIGFVGTGLIAEHVRLFFRDLDWPARGYRIFDVAPEAAQAFATRLVDGGAGDVAVCADVAELFASCDIVVIATVAATPHLVDPVLLRTRPIVVHLSLRDLAPELVLAAQNIVDDVDHVMREATSVHLAEQRVGHRDFVAGDIGAVLRGDLARDPDRACVFSPFGLGVLDLAIGRWVYDAVRVAGGGTTVGGFFAETDLVQAPTPARRAADRSGDRMLSRSITEKGSSTR